MPVEYIYDLTQAATVDSLVVNVLLENDTIFSGPIYPSHYFYYSVLLLSIRVKLDDKRIKHSSAGAAGAG